MWQVILDSSALGWSTWTMLVALDVFFNSPEKTFNLLSDSGIRARLLGYLETSRGKVLGFSACSMHWLTFFFFFGMGSLPTTVPGIPQSRDPLFSLFNPLLRIHFQTSAGVREDSFPNCMCGARVGGSTDLTAYTAFSQSSFLLVEIIPYFFRNCC